MTTLAKAASLGVWAALLAPAAALAQGGGDQASSRWAEIAACATLPDAGRHQCMDGVLRRSGLLNETEAIRAPSGNDRLPAPPPPRSAPPAAVQAITPQAAEPEERATTIQAVRSIGFNKFLVTAADGTAWEQSEAEDFADEPRKGAAFIVRRAPLGGYRCRFEDSPIYRCRPAQ